MTRANTNADGAAPLWAVFGAPLVGVPMMVVLLALGSGPTADTAAEPVGVVATEPLEVHDLDAGIEARALHD